MGDVTNRRPSPAGNCRRPRRPDNDEEDTEPSCTGKSCQSCTAGAIADCVAVCCCPCAVVNFLALTLVRLPWAVARRLLSGRRKTGSRRTIPGGDGGIPGGGAAEGGIPAAEGEELCGNGELKADDVWLEMYEVGHLGFGRVSFTGGPYQDKGN